MDGKGVFKVFRWDVILKFLKLKRIGSLYLKEINVVNLKCIIVGRFIGSGIFGMCYLGKYRGILIVNKEYKEVSCWGGGDLLFL